MKLFVAPGILDELVGHARSCLPEESCGFLIGRDSQVERFVPSKNSLGSRTAYSVDPQTLFALFRELRASGEKLVAIYHSHPTGEASPSMKDVAEAHYPDSAHVIVSLRDKNRPEVRAFRVIDGEVTNIKLHAIV